MLKMSNLNKFLLQAALCFVILNFTSGAERKCAEYNEYCQEHWECCSNTCLTYSYRCIGKKRPSSTFERPPMTLDELLESIAEINMIPANTYNQPPNDNREKSGVTLKRLLDDHSEWGADVEEPVLQDRIAAVEGPSGTADSTNAPAGNFFLLQSQEATTLRQLEQQAQVGEAAHDSPADVPTTVKAEDGKEAAAERYDAQSAEIQCKDIGEKCYHHEECCTQRCHGFLHQCVT